MFFIAAFEVLIWVFSQHPVTVVDSQVECHLGRPFEEGMILDHPPKLGWLDAQLVYVVLQRFKLLVYQVHDVLLRFGRIGELLVVLILTHINLVLEAK